MSPADMTNLLTHIRLEGGQVVARFTDRTPDAVEALRAVKPGVILLADAADRAGCAADLLELTQVFRDDLVLFTEGAFTVEAIVDAIQTLAPWVGWRLNRRDAA